MIIVGDIHGKSDQLDKLLTILSNENRLIIFVGDYVGRGPKSRNVVSKLLALHQKKDTVFLCGNHDHAFKRYLKTGRLGSYIRNGGLFTIKSYVPNPEGDLHRQILDSMGQYHRNFFINLKIFWETDSILVSHTGADPNNPDDRKYRTMFLTNHCNIFDKSDKFGKLVVFGHYIQTSGRPYYKNNVLCLDTGCGSNDGPLTAVRIPEMDYIQVMSNLEIRRDCLTIHKPDK